MRRWDWYGSLNLQLPAVVAEVACTMFDSNIVVIVAVDVVDDGGKILVDCTD